MKKFRLTCKICNKHKSVEYHIDTFDGSVLVKCRDCEIEEVVGGRLR